MNEVPFKWFSEILICLECNSADLVQEDGGLRCTHCAVHYPVRHSVPLLLRKDSFTDAAQVIGDHLGGLSAEDVQSVFGTALRYRLADLTLRGEYANIVERYADLLPTSARTTLPQSGMPFVLTAQYFNTRFVAGQTSYRSFRLRNTSQTVWSSTGTKPWNLSYFLHDLSEAQTKIEGVRSAFPIPLRPSQELTVPLKIAAPAKAGRYRIVVKLVQEFVGWLDQPLFEDEIEIVTETVSRPDLVNNPHDGFFDFLGDLKQCGNVLRRAAAMLRTEGTTPELRVLEVACGNDPQVLRHYQPGTLVVACDVAFPQVQLGALQYATKRPSTLGEDAYQFVAADVYHPPFKAGAFDLVVISAALHHFVDVTDALRRLSNLLQPHGFLVLMREPCKVFPTDETFVKELLNGFNEQQFELEEYDEMFRRANFRPVYQQIDYECSYKVILCKSAMNPL